MKMVLYIATYLVAALRHPCVALKGFLEGVGDVGMTYDDDASSSRSVAYDVGRTVRRWDA